mmetsp:Transcript_45548/g.90260  ORF Transcript_45548/g.90260 Transcript_45548/m.90260 type:complete len:316 (-) Transcript_45548:223-1170(-)
MAPLRNVIAGGAGGAVGAAGIVLMAGGFVCGGPFGWVAAGAGVLGALYGASASAMAASVNKAFQEGLLSGMKVGGEVLKIVKSKRSSVVTGVISTTSFKALSPTSQGSASDSWTEELRNDDGERVAWARAACDLDLSAQQSDSPSRFRMASGLAATCDKCCKVLSVGNDWYHEGGGSKDLCAKHRSELPLAQRLTFHCVHSEEALGEDSGRYALKIRVPADIFPQAGPYPEGKLVLEVSHLINHKDGKETLASMLKPLMPQAKIEEHPGPRDFCRISVDMRDEAAVREVIKSLGQQRNKRVGIKVVSREFYSPRF